MRLLLRLDDGSLIGQIKEEGKVEKINPTQAQEQGRLTEADRRRINELLKIAAANGAQLNGGSKRKDLDMGEGFLDTKRSKPRPATRRASSDQSYGSSGGHMQGQGWVEKCLQLNQKMLDNCGTERMWFDQPVQTQYIPDYYEKVANPMDLGTIQTKLQTGKYRDPEGFCRDMRLVWDNCIFYNGKQNGYGKLGERQSRAFEEMWAASGLDTGSRHRRSTAGHAAMRYDALDEEEEQQRSMRKLSSARTLSTSKSLRHTEEAATVPMDRDQIVALATWMQELDADVQEGAIKIIRDRGFGKGSEDDEIELDFDALDTETLWALDDYMMQQTGGKAESPEKANSGFQVEPESDYESEESDLSD